MPRLSASNAKVVLLSIATIVSLCLSAGAAFAGTVGPAFTAPYDFDQTGTSDVLLHRLSGPNTGINETQMVSGVTSTSRGWPDLNYGNANTVEYETLGAGNFDGNANGQAQILTRKIAGNFLGLVRIVKLQTDGITRFDAAPTSSQAQFFLGGVGTDYDFLGVGDCNGDGTDDIVYHKVSGPNIGLIRIQFLSPSTPFTVLTTQFPGSLPVEGGGARGVALNVPIGVADADGDGQADIWTIDNSTDGVEILINAADVDSGGAFESAQNPSTVPTGYVVAGIGLFNRADAQADLLLENDTNPTNPGVLRIDYTGDDGGATNAPPTVFPALLDVSIGETAATVGDYDGLNQTDILTRLESPTNPSNTGALIVRLMNSDGTDLAGSSGVLPQIESLDYEVVDNSPVVGP